MRMTLFWLGFAVSAMCAETELTPSGPIVLDNVRDAVIENLHITSTTGECVLIRDSTNVVIRNSNIGPCEGNGIKILRSKAVSIYDSYVHPEGPPTPCCDRSNAIFIDRSSVVKIQGNVIAFGQSNVEILGGTDIWVIGNYLLNPQDTTTKARGHQVQSWSDSKRIVVVNNYLRSTQDATIHPLTAKQEDGINFGLTDTVTVAGNYIEGGRSPSGCGIIADWGTQNSLIEGNTLVNTGQCGIGISSGRNHRVEENRILNSTPVPSGGNTAIYVWKVSPESPACSGVRIADNIASHVKPDGSESGFWNGGGCEPVTVSGNTFGLEARKLLTQPDETLRPPAIPPHPHSCAAPSPFTTQKGCLGAAGTPRGKTP